MTRGELLDTVYAGLDERLIVDDPQPFGDGIIVTKAVVEGQERVLVAQPGGPQFAVTLSEIDFTQAAA